MHRFVMKNVLFIAAVIAAGPLLSSPAQATLITSGSGNVSPDLFSSSISGTVLGKILDSPFSNTTINGTYSTEVISDSNRSGMLDFTIQITNGNAEVLENVTSGKFNVPISWTTDVGYLGAGLTAGDLTSPTTGGVAPNAVSRNVNAVINFGFTCPSGQTCDNSYIGNGQSTNVLVIETNAVQFSNGHIGIIDSTTASVEGFQPVPEPGSLAMLGTALVGFGFLGWLRRRRPSI